MKVHKDSGSKGYDAMHNKGYHNPNARPGPSQMELHGHSRGGASTPHLTRDRLNAAQPPPPSPAKATDKRRQNVPGATAAQRSSAVGGLRDMATPTGSTQAQFQNSTQNLPQRPMHQQHNMSQAPPQNGRPAEPQPSGFQKFLKVLCCG